MMCPRCGRPRLCDAFSGEGGAGEGYRRAGFCCTPVDTSAARLEKYRTDCPAVQKIQTDAVVYLAEHGHEYAVCHASPTCTGYCRGTVAIPDRLTRYDRLIGVTREALLMTGRPYILENVEGARDELRDPLLLCGKAFGLTATDDDGTRLVLRRHRLFESNLFLMAPECPGHPRREQVAGLYGGARRDKTEARKVRKGGYVPPNPQVLAALTGIDPDRMSERGLFLSIPPAYTECLGEQILDHLAAAA